MAKGFNGKNKGGIWSKYLKGFYSTRKMGELVESNSIQGKHRFSLDLKITNSQSRHTILTRAHREHHKIRPISITATIKSSNQSAKLTI